MRKHTVFLVLVAILALVVSGCAPSPAPSAKAVLKGRVVVPQEAVRQVGGQAFPGAEVRVKDLKGNVVATTITDANGNYRVEVPPGGPYVVEAVKGNLKVLCVSPQVEVGQTYDLGTADATSTAVALVFQARVTAGEDPAQINLEELKEEVLKDPKSGNLVQAVEEALEEGKDPTTAPEVTHLVDVIVSPPKPMTPTTPVTPAPDTTPPELESVSPERGEAILSLGETFKFTVDAYDAGGLYELEIDHSLEKYFPEFSVYADENNPYGTAQDKTAFDARGVTVTYDAAKQKWVIDFGEKVTGDIISDHQGKITFYVVIKDLAGNKFGSMSPPTPENTFAYTLKLDPEAAAIKKLQEETDLKVEVDGNVVTATVTYPQEIDDVLADWLADAKLIVDSELPEGTKVDITYNSIEVTPEGGDAGGKKEAYLSELLPEGATTRPKITVHANKEYVWKVTITPGGAIDTMVTVQVVISKNNFNTEEVIAEDSNEPLNITITLSPATGSSEAVQSGNLQESKITLSSNYNATGLTTFISLKKDNEAVNFNKVFKSFNLKTGEDSPYNMVALQSNKSTFRYGPSGGYPVIAGVDQVTTITGNVKSNAPVGTYTIITEIKDANNNVLATATYTLTVKSST